jgi:hypothetical protein
MAAVFDEGGLRFQYPENWRLEREESDDGWTISLQSPETAFMLISVNSEVTSTDEMLQTTLDALKADYEDLEFDETVESIAGQPRWATTFVSRASI